MIDDGGSPDLSESADPEVVWADEQLLIGDDLFGPTPPEFVAEGLASAAASNPDSSLPEGIWGETAPVEGTAQSEMAEMESGDDMQIRSDDLSGAPPPDLSGDAPHSAPSDTPAFPLPEEIWGESPAVRSTAAPEGAPDHEWQLRSDDLFGAPSPDLLGEAPVSVPPSRTDPPPPQEIWNETTEFEGTAEPEVAAGAETDGDWWLPNHGDEGADAPGTPLVAPSESRRPRLAPPSAPVARRRWSGGLDFKKGVAAMALVVVAGGGLIVTMVSRDSDQIPASAPQQIDAAGVRPTSTLPTSTLPRPTTSVTTPVTLEQPATPTSEEPATTSPPGSSPPSSTGRTPVTTAASTSPVRAAAPVTTAAPPPPPAPAPAPPPPPAPTPTATTAPPPPTTIFVPEPEEPTVTTRRPRPTVPETTVAPSTTVPTSGRFPFPIDGD